MNLFCWSQAQWEEAENEKSKITATVSTQKSDEDYAELYRLERMESENQRKLVQEWKVSFVTHQS